MPSMIRSVVLALLLGFVQGPSTAFLRHLPAGRVCRVDLNRAVAWPPSLMQVLHLTFICHPRERTTLRRFKVRLSYGKDRSQLRWSGFVHEP